MKLFLKSMVLRNFMSFGNNDTEINFSPTGTFHILGRNEDTNSHNGAGKTTILNALSYVLYDKPLSNISKEKLLNKTNKAKDTDMMVDLEFDVNDVEYRIVRNRGSQNGVIVYKEGNDITPASIADTNKFIEDLIGVSYALFKRTVVFSGSETSFFEESAKVQREIIEELLNISILSEKADLLKDDAKDVKKSIEIQEAVVGQQRGAAENYILMNSQAKARVDNWVVTNQQDIETLESEIESISNIDFETEQNLHDQLALIAKEIMSRSAKFESVGSMYNTQLGNKEHFEKEKATMTANLAKIKDIDFDAEFNKFDELEQLRLELPEFESQTRINLSKMKDAEKKRETAIAQLVHLEDNKCPFCEQQFADTGAKIAELQDIVAAEDEAYNQASEFYSEFSRKAEEFANGINIIKSNLVFQKRDELTTAKNNKAQYEERLKTIDAEIEAAAQDVEQFGSEFAALEQEMKDYLAAEATIKSEIKHPNLQALLERKASVDAMKAKLEELRNATNPHQDAWDELLKKGEPKVDTDTLDELKDDLEHMNFLIKLLTHKDSFIRKKIINRSIPYLNARLQEYTKTLGLPHVVRFNADMKVSISEHGRELDYGNLSGGEQNRLNHGLSWAFRDTRQYLLSKINILFTDEIDGGSVCPNGVEDIIQLLKVKAADDGIGIWVISHRPEMNNRFDSEITVIKEHGFSRIEFPD